MQDQLNVSVVLAIFLRDSEGRAKHTKCAFYDKDGKIFLPTAPVTHNQTANQAAISLLKTLVPIGNQVSASPIGFFDFANEENMAERTILLGYLVLIAPGMPIFKELEFKDYEDLGLSAERIKSDHFAVFRAALAA